MAGSTAGRGSAVFPTCGHGHCGDRRGPQRSRTSRRFSRWRRDRRRFRRSVRGRRLRRTRFRPASSAWDVSVPEFDGADDEHLAVVAASLPSGGSIALVRNGRLASSISTRPDNGLRSGSTMLARSLWASSQAQPYRAFLERQELMAPSNSGTETWPAVGRHQVGGPEPDGRQLAGVQDRRRHRGLPAAAGALEGVCFPRAAPIPFHGRTRDRRSRPASAFRSARRRRRHRPGTCAGRRGGLSGTCFMWWLRRQERIGNILPLPPP